VLALLGCAGERAPEAADPAPSIRVTSPATGDSVALPVVINLAATGLEVIPASGVAEPGRGHHHLVIDRDLPDPSLPIPVGPGFVHLGTGAQTYTLDSLAAGEHRIIAYFATGDHVPMPGVRPDTIRFTIRQP
jgi:hypothetical protein